MFKEKNYEKNWKNKKSFDGKRNYNKNMSDIDAVDGDIKNQNNKEPKYNEKDTTKKFLLSDKGFLLLLNKGKPANFKSESTLDEIENIIDFYCAWTSSFPVRKNLKMSKYDFLKSVEDFCEKPENSKDIMSLLNNHIKTE